MYQTSEQFNSAILGDYRRFQSKLRIGTSEVTEGFRSIKQTIRSTNGDNISVGGAISSYIEVEMWYPQLLLGNAEIEWILTLELPSGGIEEIPMGLFTVQDPKEDDGVVRFAAYDRIYSKMGMPYFSELNYPADGKDILREISSQTGVPIDVSTLPDGVLVDRIKISSGQSLDENGNAVTNETFSNPFDGYIHREALGNIAMIYGRIAVMDRAGNVVFKWYSNTDYSVGIDRHYGDLVLNESVFSVGTISCQTGSSVLTSGSGTENVYLENNIMTQSKLDAIYQQFQALEYIPATFSFLGDSRLDICDIITVHDIKGNLIKVPLMEIVQEYDGGLLTRVKSFGGVNQESSAVKGPTVQKMDRMYTELFLAKELIGNKATFEDLKSINAEFRVMKADMITAEFIETRYAKIDLANIKAGSITSAMLGTAVVGTTQIADGSITDAKIVDLTANKITAGTLSVERLEIRGSDKSIVYALNNITGALQSQNVNTLNGEILTQRSITSDKIVAKAITASEIASKTITANEILSGTITANEIAANAITSTKIAAGAITAEKIATGAISADKIDVNSLFSRTIDVSGIINIGVGQYVMSLNAGYLNTSGVLLDADNCFYDLRMSLGYVYLHMEKFWADDASKRTNLFIKHDEISIEGYGNGNGSGYNGNFFTVKYDIQTSTATINTAGTFTHKAGEIINTYPNGLRIAYGNYGFFIRNDGDSTYFMLTNSGEALNGTWNSLRPIVIKDSTGLVNMQNGLVVHGALAINKTSSSIPVINMGQAHETATDRQIKFQVTSGTYTHYSYIYGGNSSSPTAIGVWDNKNGRGVWLYNDVHNTLEVNASLIPKGGLELYGVYPCVDFHYNNSSTDYTSRICEYSSGVLNINGVTFTLSTNSISAAKGTFHGTYTGIASQRYSAGALEIRESSLVGSAQSDIGYAPSIGFHWSGRTAASIVLDSSGRFQFLNQQGSNAPIISSHLWVACSGTTEAQVVVSNGDINGVLCASQTCKLGIYNNTAGAWSIYAETNNNIVIGNKAVVPPGGDTAIRGNGDATYDCGHTSYLWKTVYSKNGVKTTSDEREKDIMSLDLSEMSDCFMSLEPIAFRWKYGNDEKIHLGIGAQTTERKMIEAGYDPSQFDMIQHDDLEVVSDSGLMERYGINYQDLNMLTMMQTQKTTRDLWKLQEWALSTDIELAVINQKQETQEARIRDLELQLADALLEIEQLKARIA